MMPRIIFCFLFLSHGFLQAQQTEPKIGLRWAPLALLPGSISLHGEYNFGKTSLLARFGLPVKASRQFEYDNKDAEFDMKATTFSAGFRTYLSKKPMKGFYLEPYFKYVHHASEGSGQTSLAGDDVILDFTNEYNGTGLGLQLGFQFLVRKKISIDLFFLGPEINSSRNRFFAVETTDAIAWTTVEASEAEHDIREFIDQFPIIRNKVDVMVNREEKTVTANFKGAVPGIRTGIAIGILF